MSKFLLAVLGLLIVLLVGLFYLGVAIGMVVLGAVMTTLAGYLIGYTVAWLFPATTAAVMAWLAIPASVSLASVGAMLGFVAVFVRQACLSTTVELKTKEKTAETIKKILPGKKS